MRSSPLFRPVQSTAVQTSRRRRPSRSIDYIRDYTKMAAISRRQPFLFSINALRLSIIFLIINCELLQGFPLTRQLLTELDGNGSQQQQHIRRSDSSNSNTDDAIFLSTQIRHFRHRHERRRVNKAKEALVSCIFLFFAIRAISLFFAPHPPTC